jgi:hypothetical protein
MDKVKMIKKDAIIKIQVGVRILENLHKLLMYIASDIQAEDIKKYTEECKTYDPSVGFSEEWMYHISTISVLVKEIEDKAEEQGGVYEASLDEAVKEVNSENSSLPDQSPEQPE